MKNLDIMEKARVKDLQQEEKINPLLLKCIPVCPQTVGYYLYLNRVLNQSFVYGLKKLNAEEVSKKYIKYYEDKFSREQILVQNILEDGKDVDNHQITKCNCESILPQLNETIINHIKKM